LQYVQYKKREGASKREGMAREAEGKPGAWKPTAESFKRRVGSTASTDTEQKSVHLQPTYNQALD